VHRETARIDRLLSKAGFYTVKSFSGFRFDEVNLPSNVTPEYLKELKFLETKTNIVMYGNVGTGKTYLSTALGVEACKRGIETRFFRTAALVNRLSEAKRDGTLSSFMKKILKSELIICDEWGYVPLDVTGAQLLFEIISECYEQKTLIINTNIEFSRWVNVFYDKDMTAAILDRMLHHCHLLLFPGDSNRMRESSISGA
jgi:DNA replication protein DnaC